MMLSAYRDLPDEVRSLVDAQMVKGIPTGELLAGVQQLYSC
jgi:hypothetical protein